MEACGRPLDGALQENEDIAARLLAWYDRSRRDLPWRSAPGEPSDAYAVWLSEIMLQQTTVKAVTPYYVKFLRAWPTVETLAAASLDDVLRAWAGLGYYSRARNLHRCARAVVESHGGRFPETAAALQELPGIGPYTAAAIAAIAFGEPATVVDGNVERVVARLCAVETPLPPAKPELRRLAATLTPDTRPGDYAQAMMDLGATICTPRSPSCLLCPLSDACAARAQGLEAALPYKLAKAARPTRRAMAFFALSRGGAVLLRRRPERGLLGGMMEVPSSDWREGQLDEGQALKSAPLDAAWSRLPGLVTHTFTHFHLELVVQGAHVAGEAAEPSEGGLWVPRRDLHAEALPSVMRKVIAHGLDAMGG